MGQALRKAAAGPAVRRSQSIEEVKQYAEFQKSLVERKALLLQQQKQQQKVASTPSPMIPEVHDRQVNIGVERQMLQLLPGITQREVEVEIEHRRDGKRVDKTRKGNHRLNCDRNNNDDGRLEVTVARCLQKRSG